MIDSVSVLSNLGNSDHNTLLWDLQLKPALTLFSRQCSDYAKADFTAMRKALGETDWTCLLPGDANEKWRTFHALLKELENKYIPPSRSTEQIERKHHGWLIKLLGWLNKSMNCTRNTRRNAIQLIWRQSEKLKPRSIEPKGIFEKKLADDGMWRQCFILTLSAGILLIEVFNFFSCRFRAVD